MVWGYLALAILAEVLATSALKASENFTKFWPTIGVVLGYGTAFFLLSITLKSIPVGIAYAIWSGAGIVLISAIAWVLYRQALDAPAMIGMALIISGVVVINAFSSATAH